MAITLLTRLIRCEDDVLAKCYEDDDAGRIFERAHGILEGMDSIR